MNIYAVLITCIFGCNGSRPLLDVPLLGHHIHILFKICKKNSVFRNGMALLFRDIKRSQQVNFDQYMQNIIETLVIQFIFALGSRFARCSSLLFCNPSILSDLNNDHSLLWAQKIANSVTQTLKYVPLYILRYE